MNQTFHSRGLCTRNRLAPVRNVERSNHAPPNCFAVQQNLVTRGLLNGMTHRMAKVQNHAQSVLAFIAIYHGVNPARSFDRITLPITGIVFLGIAALFLVPILNTILIPLFWFASKVGVILFLYIWVRGTLPRFRYDQLMNFAWTFMFPIAIINLFVTGLLVALTSN